MTIAQVAEKLVDGGGDEHPRARDYADRLMLRMFSYPALLAYLDNIAVTESGDVEVVFHRMPDEILPNISEILASSDSKLYRFTTDFHPKIGYRIGGFKDQTEA